MVGLRDSSALFAVVGHRSATRRTHAGLRALQHRGGSAISVVASDGHTLHALAGERAVQALGEADATIALGQVYGHSPVAQDPVVVATFSVGRVAVAVAGRFTNGTRLRRELKERGALFRSGGEAEVLAHLLAQSSQGTFVNRLVDALWRVEGAFCAAVLTPECLVAVRDPHGFRPLVLGRLDDAWVLSSEDAPIRSIGGTSVREVARGEMVILDARGCQRVQPFLARARRACAQEHVVLARADATVFGQHVHAQRRGLGERLAAEHPPPARAVVVPLGSEAEDCAVAYARAARCTLELALQPESFGPGDGLPRWRVVAEAVDGRTVVLVSSGVVTGEHVIEATRALRQAGATRVVLRSASPPVRHACVYGVATPTSDELLAPRADEPGALARALGVDEFAALSLDGLVDVLGRRRDGVSDYCLACWTGDHPVTPEEPDDQLPLF
ncbi:MAG: amidophosphoribosyltransferase [Myxococcota bacterium]